MPHQYYIGGIAQALENPNTNNEVDCTLFKSTSTCSTPRKEAVIKNAGHEVVSNVSGNLVKHSKKRKLNKSSDETNRPRKKVKAEIPEKAVHTQVENKPSRKKKSKNRTKTNQQTCSVNEQIDDSEIENAQVGRQPAWKKKSQKIAKTKMHNQQVCSNEQIEDSEENNQEDNADKSAGNRANSEKEGRTIFVGNLPLSTTRKDMKSLFSCYGKVESVRHRSVVPLKMGMSKKVAVIQSKFNSEKDSINAYVVMDSVESANKALASNGTLLVGHHIRVDLAAKKEHDHRLSVFVGNLPFNCQDEELFNFFGQSFDVESVRVVRDSETGICKGFGFVMFKSKDGVELALKMEKEFKGRQLRIKRSKKQQKRERKKHTPQTGMRKFEGKKTFEGVKSSKGVKERKRMQRKIKFANIANKQKARQSGNTGTYEDGRTNGNVLNKQKARPSDGISQGGRTYGNNKAKTTGGSYKGGRPYGNVQQKAHKPGGNWNSKTKAPGGSYKASRNYGNAQQKTNKPGGNYKGGRTYGNSKAKTPGGSYKGGRPYGNNVKQKAKKPGKGPRKN